MKRRALGAVSTWFDVLSNCDCDCTPESMLYQLHVMTEVLIEISARLEEAEPPLGVEAQGPDDDDEPSARDVVEAEASP